MLGELPQTGLDIGERAPKYAKCLTGDRFKADKPGVLEDITNLTTSLLVSQGAKCTTSPFCDEAESTGVGQHGHCDFSEEEDDEDPFGQSDFEDFPNIGTGSSHIPGVGSREMVSPHLSDVDRELAHSAPSQDQENPPRSQRSAPETREEAQRSLAGSQPESSAAGAAHPAPVAWRSPTEVEPQQGPRPFGLPAGWRPRHARSEASPTDSSSGAAQQPSATGMQRVMSSLRLGSEETVDGTDVPVVQSDQEDDPQDVPEYSGDILNRLAVQEACPLPDYMEAQPDLTGHMRAVAIDWMMEVQMKFTLRTETLFLAVSLLDRYLSMKRVRRKDLQLTCVSSLFIAAKFEEIEPPDVRDFVFITKQACKREHILGMEVTMLTTLEFCLCRPTAAHFFERYGRANRCSEVHRHLYQYILELALLDLSMTQYSPHHQATAALLLSCRVLNLTPVFPATLASPTEAAQRAVRKCCCDLCSLLEAAPKNTLQAVRKKFSRPEYSSVASMKF